MRWHFGLWARLVEHKTPLFMFSIVVLLVIVSFIICMNRKRPHNSSVNDLESGPPAGSRSTSALSATVSSPSSTASTSSARRPPQQTYIPPHLRGSSAASSSQSPSSYAPPPFKRAKFEITAPTEVNKPKIEEDRQFGGETARELKTIFLNYVNQQQNEQYPEGNESFKDDEHVFYTDGGVVNNIGGCCFIFMDYRNNLKFRQFRITGDNVTSSFVEMTGVRLALEHYLNLPKEQKRDILVIRTDHRNIIDKLNQKVEKESSYDELVAKIKDAGKSNLIKVQWVHGHSADPGNNLCYHLSSLITKSEEKASEQGPVKAHIPFVRSLHEWTNIKP